MCSAFYSRIGLAPFQGSVIVPLKCTVSFPRPIAACTSVSIRRLKIDSGVVLTSSRSSILKMVSRKFSRISLAHSMTLTGGVLASSEVFLSVFSDKFRNSQPCRRVDLTDEPNRGSGRLFGASLGLGSQH